MKRLGYVGVVLAALFAATAPASAALPQSELVDVRRVAQDTDRYTYRYGPLVAAPGQNLVLVGPVTIEKPAIDAYSVRVKPNLVTDEGTPPPVEQLHMHHAVMLNMSRPDRTSPEYPERFYGFAEEKTIAELPAPYGYPVKATDVWAINYMLHNGTGESETVYIEYEVDLVPMASPRGQSMRPAYPLWVDVENGRAYPVFDVHRGSGRNGRFRYPQDAGNPYGDGRVRNEWTVDRDGVLLASAGHLHPGGLWTDLEVQRGERSTRVFRSKANYFDPNGPVSWDMAMDYTPPDWRVGVKKGDVLRVSTTYETERATWYESMGLNLIYWAEDEPGPDPFTDQINKDGAPTHGHLPEAGNYGGEPLALADPASLPDGQTAGDGVGIEDFFYTPGDRTLSGPLGNPPVVPAGGSLRFANFDAAASIFHTVTACKAPCIGATGVSYPLADGDVQFDSGQLGFGPDGLSPAAQRMDWETPKDLDPGTYSYFCRVHPFMRGAFRVPGEPRPRGEDGSAGRVRVLSRRLRMRRGRVKVRLGCEGGACEGRVRLRRRGRTLGAARYSLAAGNKVRVRVRLKPRARRLLKQRGSVRVRVRAGRASRRLRLAR